MTSEIVSAEIFLVPLEFRMQFKHAGASRAANETLFIKIVDSAGKIGWGETLTRSYLTGETPDSVMQTVKDLWPEIKKIQVHDDLSEQLTPLWREADRCGANAAWSLVDVALYDLWMRNMQMFGRSAVTAAVTFPVGFGLAQKILPSLAKAMGFEVIKIKSGPANSAVKSAKRAKSRFRCVIVDANGGYPSVNAGELIQLLEESAVRFFEQPFARDDWDSAAQLIRDKGVDLIADESLCSYADAEKIVKTKAATVFNVRLAKVGGITGALALSELARKNSLLIQLGSLVGETALLANAARFCFDRIRPEFYEYSFPELFLKIHPVKSGLPRMAAEVLGLGLLPDGMAKVSEESIRKLSIKRLELA